MLQSLGWNLPTPLGKRGAYFASTSLLQTTIPPLRPPTSRVGLWVLAKLPTTQAKPGETATGRGPQIVTESPLDGSAFQNSSDNGQHIFVALKKSGTKSFSSNNNATAGLRVRTKRFRHMSIAILTPGRVFIGVHLFSGYIHRIAEFGFGWGRSSRMLEVVFAGSSSPIAASAR